MFDLDAYLARIGVRGKPALAEHSPGEAPRLAPVDRQEIPHLLASRFGLSGFTLDQGGRVTEAAER